MCEPWGTGCARISGDKGICLHKARRYAPVFLPRISLTFVLLSVKLNPYLLGLPYSFLYPGRRSCCPDSRLGADARPEALEEDACADSKLRTC